MSVRVSVPATSANLGPGFDSLGAALGLRLEVTVEQADAFSLTTDLDLPKDRSNLLVRSFEGVLPADGWAFTVSSQIPLCGGLGSSASAVLGGLLAARELGGELPDLLVAATAIEGHGDNVAAALHGGITINAEGVVTCLSPPEGITVIVVAPREAVPTSKARSVLPAAVPLADAAANAASAALLGAGLATGDHEKIALGLRDRLHQRHRAELFPRSAGLVDHAASLGAIGATISGAGPAVLVWAATKDEAKVTQALVEHCGEWAQVVAAGFENVGALVNGEPVR
jgi:homoserine kinase